MGFKRFRGRSLAALIATLALLVAACSPAASAAPTTAGTSAGATTQASAGATTQASGGKIGGSVSFLGVWGGSELDSFNATLAPFEAATGITVKYVGTRDISAVLAAGAASGQLPDIATPNVGELNEFSASGVIKPLDGVIDLATYKADTTPGLVDLGTVGGKLTGIFDRASIKGLIWYDPKVYTGGVPTSWDDLQAKATAAATAAGATTKPWCVGLENGAASGWPGTDWIEDFVLRQAGPDVFDKWVAGTQKWSSPEIKAAFQSFGKVVADANVFGGSKNVLATGFDVAGNPLFTSPPGCIFHHQASFITDFFVKQGGAKPGDYNFFPFPDINPTYAGAVEGAGDLISMFNDTPQAEALMKYLTTAAAQSIWVGRGGALAPNKNVTNYPDDVSKREAAILANAKIFRFDASDSMPAAMNASFFTALLTFTKDQSQLDSILSNLDTVQISSYPTTTPSPAPSPSGSATP